MKIFLVYVMETQYHYYNWEIVYCNDKEEASHIGFNMLENIFHSYRTLIKEIKSFMPLTETNQQKYIDFINSHSTYYIYELKPNINYDQVLDKELSWQEIRDNYSIKGETK